MTLLMLIITVLLVFAALAAMHHVDRWLARTDRSDEAAFDRDSQEWQSVNRGLPAARRRRREAILADGLNRQTLTRADYHRAMSELAAEDAVRCPVEVPRLHAD